LGWGDGTNIEEKNFNRDKGADIFVKGRGSSGGRAHRLGKGGTG